MRALVESARLTRVHATARWNVRVGDRVIGTLHATVSGSRDEQQLAHEVTGELHAPLAVRLKGVVLATWDRRPERLVFDVDLGGARHRVDGRLVAPGGPLRLRHAGPSGEISEWDVEEPPILAPGPLPLPVLPTRNEDLSGVADDPGGGGPVPWSLSAGRPVSLFVAGRVRRATSSELVVRGIPLRLIVEDSGMPLRLEAPGGLVAELVEDAK
jgi:hypothetical protein